MKHLSLLLLNILMVAITLQGQTPFVFANESISPGTKATFRLPITDGTDSTFIPISVFHGRQDGPVLGITAGVHGYEYPPIIAAQHIAQELDPAGMSGTVILVQIANIPSFLGRSPFSNPMDGKNLNRSFPGAAAGSITERIAPTITEQVITRSDYFIDMHGGDAPEDLRPYSAYYTSTAFPEASEKGKAMAKSMGFDHVVIFNIPEERVKERSLYCSQEAFHRQIPAVDIECGRLGIAGEYEITRIRDAIFSVLRHLEILEGNPIEVPGQLMVPVRKTFKSPQTGVFYPLKKGGDYVAKGMKVGYINDFFGNHLEDIFAITDGIIMYMIGTPPVQKGETLISIGVLEE